MEGGQRTTRRKEKKRKKEGLMERGAIKRENGRNTTDWVVITECETPY